MIYGGYFDIDNKKEKIKALDKEMLSENFWNNQERSNEVISELNELKSSVKLVDDLLIKAKDLNSIINEQIDMETHTLIEEETSDLTSELDKLNLLLLLNKEYDKNNCILEIHSGAGGTEACDWANMIYRMYTRWLDKKGYKYEVIDYQEGDEVGIKSVSLFVKGMYSYGYLKCEKGIHRLVRLSPFDSNHKRHTSFASVFVTPEIEEVADIEIDPKDLKIDVYRSSGNGGQGVNTTDSAVRITHLPTKIVVTCQNGRSQIQNKEKALQILKNKLKIKQIEEFNEKKNLLKGEQKNIDFGSQIRSYVMHPYSMVKDHRSLYETSNVSKVLDGELDDFINSNLRRR